VCHAQVVVALRAVFALQFGKVISWACATVIPSVVLSDRPIYVSHDERKFHRLLLLSAVSPGNTSDPKPGR